ncbi:MAG TPA: hypothetical protein VID74_01105 [Gemmatimonadales bacterium]|jgi:hypothetical protein
MIRRLTLALAATALAAAASSAQLPLITVPTGALRIDLAGSFYPNDHYWDGGSTRPLGSTIDGTANPLVSALQTGLGQLLGTPVTGLGLGKVTALAAREHGVGTVGLGYGLTHRITIFVNAPLVYVRTRVSMSVDPSTARVGLNPGGDAAFFAQFDAALASLSAKIQHGDYAGDPATLALAQQTLASGSALRTGTFALLADPVTASPVLPVRTDAYGVQLLQQITTLQGTLSNQLGVTSFMLAPGLPATPLTSDNFAALVASPVGFSLTTTNKLSQLVLGDIEAGVAVQLIEHGAPGDHSWDGAWLRVAGRFPTAAAADPGMLLDQDRGDQHPSVQLDATAEIGRGRLGLRGEATYQHDLAAIIQQRITTPEEVLVPPSYLASLRSQPGDSVAVTVRPFLRFAPHFALAAVAQYWWKRGSHTSYASGQAPISGIDPTALDVGSAANALIVGIGMNYSYAGANRLGEPSGLPVEAGWSIERIVHSGEGIFPDAMTSRVTLRIYRPLIRH